MIEGIFIGTQIKQIFKDLTFSTKLNSRERRAWKTSENVSETVQATQQRKITVKFCSS